MKVTKVYVMLTKGDSVVLIDPKKRQLRQPLEDVPTPLVERYFFAKRAMVDAQMALDKWFWSSRRKRMSTDEE